MPKFEQIEFDVELLVEIKTSLTTRTVPRSDKGVLWSLFGNRDYVDLGEFTRIDAHAVQQREANYLNRIALAEDWHSEYEEVLDEISEDCDWPGLDLGVAGTVLALHAAGCLTGASCNGGAFGDWHHEDHPLIVFVPTPDIVEVLRSIAQQVGAGLQTTPNGALLLYTRKIKPMMAFGNELIRSLSP